MFLRCSLLYEDAVPPKRKHSTDAGADLYAYLADMDGYTVYPGDEVIMRTGVTVEIPKNHFGFVGDKSSKDYTIVGRIVDESYQGEILVKIANITDKPIHFSHGDSIAQLLIIPCITPEIEIVDMIDIHKTKTERGESGGIVSQSKSQLRRINIQTGKPMDEQLPFIKDWDTQEEDKTWEKL